MCWAVWLGLAELLLAKLLILDCIDWLEVVPFLLVSIIMLCSMAIGSMNPDSQRLNLEGVVAVYDLYVFIDGKVRNYLCLLMLSTLSSPTPHC
jgi:hypothetical protein